LEAANDLHLEATTGLEATSSTTTEVAKLSTSAYAVPAESLTLLSSACASIASDPHTSMLPEQAQKKLLGYRSFHKKLLGYQKKKLSAIHERPNLKATTHLNMEVTKGFEATNRTTTVAKLSTSASAVPVESLTLLLSACASIPSDPHTRIQFGSVFQPSPDRRILRRSLRCC
jgi:hypothetical protein